MRKKYMKFANNREVKSDSQSDIIVETTLCNRITSHMMISANSLAVISGREGM